MSVETITTISPTTNEPVLSRNGVSTSDLGEIPKAAAEAFKTWQQTTLVDRTIIIKKALKLLEEQKDQLAEELTVQMGRPIAYTGVESKDANEIPSPQKRSKLQLTVLSLISCNGYKTCQLSH